MNASRNYPLFGEIVSHFHLFSIDKKRIGDYFSSPYRIILIVLFTILFLPHVFVVVRDINFVIAYEVDPGSIIQSILSLYKNSYNMNIAYHSKYYGWTYYWISYVLLMPIYLAKVFNILKDDYLFFVGLRFIFFAIGLSSVLVYFEVAKRILKDTLFAFVAALLYIASPAIFSYFYFLHPESTGLLFSFLGVLCLLRFTETKGEDYRWYTFGLLSLVLSALSKQVFFITALPVLFLFYYAYCYYHNLSLLKFAFSWEFLKALLLSSLFALLIFFIINPYAFIQFREFIGNQIFMFSTQTSGTISHAGAIQVWLEMVKQMPILYLSILSAPITLVGAFIIERENKIGRVFFVVSMISSILYVIMISASARYLIQIGYFAPIYPYFILNFLVISLYIVRKWNFSLVKFIVNASLVYILFFILISDFSVSIPQGYKRLMYQDTPIYKVYTYIKNKIPDGSKIAYDHLVAIPSTEGIIGCQYWSGCGTDYIEQFKPDYVIFSETWKFNGQILPETLRLEKYVSDHHFILIDTLNYGKDEKISVWKKPDQ